MDDHDRSQDLDAWWDALVRGDEGNDLGPTLADTVRRFHSLGDPGTPSAGFLDDLWVTLQSCAQAPPMGLNGHQPTAVLPIRPDALTDPGAEEEDTPSRPW